MQLETRVQFVAAQTIEFWPNGTAHIDQGTGDPWPEIPSNDPVEITLQRSDGNAIAQAASLRTIEVNGLGRIRIQ